MKIRFIPTVAAGDIHHCRKSLQLILRLVSSRASNHRVNHANEVQLKMHVWGLLIVAVSVTLCDAQCWLKNIDSDAKGCIDKTGVLHPFNSEWRTADCYSCSCTKKSLECCSLVATPTDYDKEKCESIFNQETCSYRVVEKADPSKLCEVYGMVG
nr:beta-microseminoprotein-like isoform X1 [Pelodiscus sinensis]|eukprot:XP_014426512.1 beta-microseminoprotein-like isoform X1 [Pelodiscus sinensis]